MGNLPVTPTLIDAGSHRIRHRRRHRLARQHRHFGLVGFADWLVGQRRGARHQATGSVGPDGDSVPGIIGDGISMSGPTSGASVGIGGLGAGGGVGAGGAVGVVSGWPGVSGIMVSSAPTTTGYSSGCSAAHPCYRPPLRPRGRGGIGRRSRFRSCHRKMWGFESLRPHHRNGRAEHSQPGHLIPS